MSQDILNISNEIKKVHNYYSCYKYFTVQSFWLFDFKTLQKLLSFEMAKTISTSDI